MNSLEKIIEITFKKINDFEFKSFIEKNKNKKFKGFKKIDNNISLYIKD